MALSEELRRRLRYGVGNRQAGDAIADAIDSGGNPVAANVAEIGVTSDLTLASPAVVDLNSTFSDIEVEAALDDKADQQAVSDMMDDIESRLDSLESKIDEVIDALKDASLMSSS